MIFGIAHSPYAARPVANELSSSCGCAANFETVLSHYDVFYGALHYFASMRARARLFQSSGFAYFPSLPADSMDA